VHWLSSFNVDPKKRKFDIEINTRNKGNFDEKYAFMLCYNISLSHRTE